MAKQSKLRRFFDGLKAYTYWPTWSAQSGTGWGYGVERFFLNRRTLNVNDPQALPDAYAQHELAFACVNKIADVMNDAEIIVEKSVGKGSDAKWEKVQGHPLSALFKRSNPHETGRDLRRLMVQSEQVHGLCYVEIIRSRAGMPVEFYVLNPNRVTPRTKNDYQRDLYGQGFSDMNGGHIPGVQGELSHYEYYRGDGSIYNIRPENMLVRRRVDLVNRFYGLSPLAVALKSVNSDIGLTDYIDAFFESDGTPSGLLKIENRTMTREEAESLQATWKKNYSRGGANHKGVAILDQDADYQKLGSGLNELDTENISSRFESRICSVFGVPPILVGALVGLTHTTTNATAKSALNDFWDNKINPELAQLREWLTQFVLPMFEDIAAIQSEKIRVGFDISQAAFLQEDQNETHARTRENFKAGLVMLNEAREAIGLMPDDSTKGKDYYVQPANVMVISPERRAEDAETDPEPIAAPDPPQLTEGDEQETLEPEKEEVPKAAFITAFPVKAVTEQLAIVPVIEPEVKAMIAYDGLMLSREPDYLEKLCDLKSIVNELEINQERAEKVLSRFRVSLIEQAVGKLDAMTAETAPSLLLEPDKQTRKDLAKAVRNAYATGQNQVARELLAQQKVTKTDAVIRAIKAIDEGDLEYIEDVSDILVSRIINEIQTRAINQYLGFRLLTNYTAALLRDTLLGQSLKWIKDLASSAINAAIQSGRADEANDRKDEWDKVQYSAILDANTCGPCEEADGMEADDPADLPQAPNPDCDGGARCRCFHIYIVK